MSQPSAPCRVHLWRSDGRCDKCGAQREYPTAIPESPGFVPPRSTRAHDCPGHEGSCYRPLPASIPGSPREAHEPSKALSENERLRQFVEGVVEVCAWGRDAWVPIDDGGSVQDWGEKLGLLVPVAHQQPCTVEGCECDGATELLQFAWKVAPRNPESVVLESPAAPENQKEQA